MRASITAMLLLAACGGSDDSADGERPLAAADLGETAEARTFLDEGAVWNELVEDLPGFVDALYAAGAKKVMFAGIEESDGMRISAWLVVELPPFPKQRKAVFAAFRAHAAPVPDTGQPYLDLPLD